FFVKKRGKKLLLGQTSASPNPSPWRRVIQSVREADTLAAEWHLPREWERRVGPETSRGRHHPISGFLWGSTPFLWARPKKWGGFAAQGKDNQKQNSEFLQPPKTHPRAGMEPRPYGRGSVRGSRAGYISPSTARRALQCRIAQVSEPLSDALPPQGSAASHTKPVPAGIPPHQTEPARTCYADEPRKAAPHAPPAPACGPP